MFPKLFLLRRSQGILVERAMLLCVCRAVPAKIVNRNHRAMHRTSPRGNGARGPTDQNRENTAYD